MNQAQVKYARQRAENLYSRKSKELSLQFVTPAVTLTAKEAIEELKAGRFTVKESYLDSKYHMLSSIIFDRESPAITDFEGQKKALDTLRIEYDTLMDELMLGDNEEAIRLLRAFEAS